MSNSGEPEGREDRNAEWVADRFGDVGEPPSNDIEVDPAAEPAPNLGDHD